jgi:phosphoribosylglycinamide formyltransferase-1
MKKIAVLFSGEGTNLQNLIDTLHYKECIIACAITNKADAKGIVRAQNAGIPVEIVEHQDFASREAFDQKLVDIIESYDIDLSIMAGFMRILTPVFTSQIKALNVHPSLLPLFKGARAIERSFESDEPTAGASVHYVTEELDGGEVIWQKSFQKNASDTLETFESKIHAVEYEILPQAIRNVLTTPLNYQLQ